MATEKHIFEQLGVILRALAPFYREAVTRWLRESGIHDNWYALNVVRSSDPDPLTIEQAHKMRPYQSMKGLQDIYVSLVEACYLDEAGPGIYRLTTRGREVIEGFFKRAHEGLKEVEPLSSAELVQLADLLWRLVEATLAAPEPVEKPSLTASRWTDPGLDAALSTRIDQYVTDLWAFRDDAHFASWQPYHLSGQQWETLTLLWQESAGTAAELAEQLAHRGFSSTDYRDALEALVKRGWAEERGSQYGISPEGKEIRQAAESTTDRIYYESWSILTSAELATLDTLLVKANGRIEFLGLKKIWQIASGLPQIIHPITGPTIRPLFEANFEDPAVFQPMLMARGNAPQPLTEPDYGKRNPYTNPQRAGQLMSKAASAGYLQKENGGYSITNDGKEILDTLNDAFYQSLAEINPLDEEDSTRLVNLLEKLVDASVHSDEPSEKWSLVNCGHWYPNDDYGTLAKIDQYLDCLFAFRDDAHIASWKPYDVDGYVWESFSLIWGGETTSAEKLAEKLTNRGYDEADYAKAIDELLEMGWIEKDEAGYQPTAMGRKVRSQAEETTDRYFFSPWSCLEANDKNYLLNLLVRLKIGLELQADEEEEAISA